MTTGDVTVNVVYTAIEYTVTFKNGDEVVGTATYTIDNKTISEPAVPVKEGYTGAWESYELTTGDSVVNAIYTEISEQPPVGGDSSEESGNEAETNDSRPIGCFGSVSGLGIAVVGLVAVVLFKKKED